MKYSLQKKTANVNRYCFVFIPCFFKTQMITLIFKLRNYSEPMQFVRRGKKPVFVLSINLYLQHDCARHNEHAANHKFLFICQLTISYYSYILDSYLPIQAYYMDQLICRLGSNSQNRPSIDFYYYLEHENKLSS